MEPEAQQAATGPARGGIAAATSHAVYLMTGNTGLHFRNENCGVTLSADRIDWIAEGAPGRAALTDIVSVHLQSGGDWTKAVRHCRIRFADGSFLLVTNGDDRGLADQAQTPIYRAFVRDLHARLVAAGRDTVRFSAGYTQGRYYVIVCCAILLGLIGVGLPLIIVLIQRDLRALTAAVAGGMLCWRLVPMIEANTPRSYQPSALPHELLR
jgi:hypothetical protein